MSATSTLRKLETLRVSAVVRVTHWITVIAFIALVISGGEIVISHPRFYWGEVGNVNTRPLFTLPIPASRHTVPTGYGYVMLDQNGWSRYLHFEAAWLAVLTGLVYVIWGLANGHFRKNLFPLPADRTWRTFQEAIVRQLRWAPAASGRGRFVQRRSTDHVPDRDLCAVSAGDLDGPGDVSGIYCRSSIGRQRAWRAADPRARFTSLFRTFFWFSWWSTLRW